MLPPVFQILKTSQAVRNVVYTPATQRWAIYRMGDPPQDPKRPYISWFLVSGTPENHLSGTPPVDRMTVQIDVWHQDDTGCENLAEAVRDTIEPYGHMTQIVINEREKLATGLYRIGMQFDLWLDRVPTT